MHQKLAYKTIFFLTHSVIGSIYDSMYTHIDQSAGSSHGVKNPAKYSLTKTKKEKKVR